jgi:hypothetical protein
MNALVVFYSRTGTTRTVARRLARELGADIEELTDPVHRLGLRGYLRSAFDAGLGRWVPVEPVTRDPTRYDLVIVGSPVWVSSVSAPVRTFLCNNARRLRKVAFFVTEGGRGDRRVFRQMADVVGAKPAATLALLQQDVERGSASTAITSFAASLRDDGVAAAMHA